MKELDSSNLHLYILKNDKTETTTVKHNSIPNETIDS